MTVGFLGGNAIALSAVFGGTATRPITPLARGPPAYMQKMSLLAICLIGYYIFDVLYVPLQKVDHHCRLFREQQLPLR